MSRFVLALGFVMASLTVTASGLEAAPFAPPAPTLVESTSAAAVYGPYAYNQALAVQRHFAAQGYHTQLVHGPEGYLVRVW